MNLLISPIRRQYFYITMLITIVGSMLGLCGVLGKKKITETEGKRWKGGREGKKEETILTLLWGIHEGSQRVTCFLCVIPGAGLVLML